LCEKYGATIEDADDEKIVDMLIEKNIVAMFQGRSENGPRALGNRSILFDPRFKDGKDFVNTVKRREYFRPFAGSILKEDVHEWFDLRGMEASPHMMYAVSCRPGVEEKIPSIIHVDGSCRIQTVAEQENPLYYRFITKFKEKTGVPIVFNTSFNLGGEPLVETLEDALWTLQQSNIEYLYIPEYAKLISIKNVA
jgi:carbamoyltransferase